MRAVLDPVAVRLLLAAMPTSATLSSSFIHGQVSGFDIEGMEVVTMRPPPGLGGQAELGIVGVRGPVGQPSGTSDLLGAIQSALAILHYLSCTRDVPATRRLAPMPIGTVLSRFL